MQCVDQGSAGEVFDEAETGVGEVTFHFGQRCGVFLRGAATAGAAQFAFERGDRKRAEVRDGDKLRDRCFLNFFNNLLKMRCLLIHKTLVGSLALLVPFRFP